MVSFFANPKNVPNGKEPHEKAKRLPEALDELVAVVVGSEMGNC